MLAKFRAHSQSFLHIYVFYQRLLIYLARSHFLSTSQNIEDAEHFYRGVILISLNNFSYISGSCRRLIKLHTFSPLPLNFRFQKVITSFTIGEIFCVRILFAMEHFSDAHLLIIMEKNNWGLIPWHHRTQGHLRICWLPISCAYELARKNCTRVTQAKKTLFKTIATGERMNSTHLLCNQTDGRSFNAGAS